MDQHPPTGAEHPSFPTVNPATGEAGRTFDGHSQGEAHAIAASTRAAFESWRRTGFDQRAVLAGLPLRRAGTDGG